MKHGVYRLAGGIDDMWTDDAYVKNTVKTDSFVIQFTKLGAVNIRSQKELALASDAVKKYDIFNFKLEAPWLAEVLDQNGDVSV